MFVTDDNFLRFCMQHYDDPHCTDVAEFESDVRRFRTIKRLFKLYDQTGKMQERSILNYMVILYNVFGPRATDMMFLKLGEYHSYIVPFMKVLNFLPARVCVNGVIIYTDSIIPDARITEALATLLETR